MVDRRIPPDDGFAELEAQLLLLADDLPKLSGTVRRRVVEASRRAHGSGRFWHRFQAAAMVALFAGAAAMLNTYYSGLLHDRIAARSTEVWRMGDGLVPAAETLAGRSREASPHVGAIEWELVDASLASRQQTFRVLQNALWH